MGHINGDTLRVFKEMHNELHNLLKRYHEDQDITEEQLVQMLESVKSTCSTMIPAWKDYLGHEN
jgi:hypothetical protein